MKMQGPMSFKYPWDIRPSLPELVPDEQDDYATKPLTPLAEDAPTETEAHVARLLAMGFREYEDLVDANGDDDGR